ncbi:MAG: membrane protein insertase YidC, partial [Chlamydiia bacterium]|nr:membrane protein insertase YidC [Chlamydiia bacterium]
KKTVPLEPKYYALNFSSDFPELATIPFEVPHFSDNKIVFKATTANRTITKTYWFEPYPKDGPYCFNLKMEVEGDTRGLWLTSGIPDVEWISGGPAPTLKYRQTRNGKPEVLQLDLPEKTVTMSTANPDWVCNYNGFLGLILNPLEQVVSGFKTEKVSGENAPSRLLVIDHGLSKFEAAKLPGYQFLLPFPEKANTMHWRIFAGPFSTKVLDAVDMIYSNPETGYESDYISCQSYHGWFTFISAPFAKFLMFLMNLFYSATGSWVLSIVLLTVALRLMLYPLNAKAFESSRKMQKIGPKVKALQDKYKKDPRQGQIEVMNLYRQEGVNPFSGCFLMLVQLPFLIGMFDLLKSNFELRGASFIPGWINDLTAPDVLFSWNYWIPFIGNSFHLLPFILGGVMFFQQRLMSPLPADQSQWTDQQRQQRSMGTMMALVFTLMFYHFPAGLNIYWLSSMLLSMLQQWWSQRK